MKKKVIILGGGLSGLAAGSELAKDFDVTIIEKNKFLGGLAASFKQGNKKIPLFYHHVFSHDYVTQDYLKKAGIFSRMNWKRIKMAICTNGKVYDFVKPYHLLNFNLLSPLGRIRYGLFGLYVFTLMNPSKIPDNLDAETWLLRHAGKEVTFKVFNELYARNKFNIPLSKISARQFAHRIKAKEFFGKFGYPSEGLDSLIDYFKEDIKKKGGKLLTGVNITGIDCKNKAIKAGKKKFFYDIIINTIPIPVFLKLSKGLPEDYKTKLSKVKYCPAVGITVGAEELLDDHYWYNLLNERIHVVIQHSWLYDGYKEKVIWAVRYGGSEKDLVLNDAKIKREYLNVIKKYFPALVVKWIKVFKEIYAEPIYDKDYISYKPNYTSPVEGLYHAGIAVTYPEIRNMNTALNSGKNVASIIKQNERV